MSLFVNESLQLPDDELTWTASRSGGPGGQNVNKVNSRVLVRFDVAHSPTLSPEQKARILERLSTRVDKGGVLRVGSQRHRSQAMNRDAALARLAELLREALTESAPRVETRPSRAARLRRLEDKTRRSSIKRDRSTRPDPD